jgi:molybdate transport system substrate-binding protein
VALLAATLAANALACTRESRGPVLVFAAASVADLVETLAGEFTAEGGAEIRVSSGASVLLQRQIESGAPADLFISAAVEPADALIAAGLARREDRFDLLGNRLAVVIRRQGPGIDLELPELRPPLVETLALGDPRLVPAGQYGREALRWLGLWEVWEGRLTPAPNVRAVLAYVETGVAEAGIVYLTDARISQRLRTAGVFPVESHTPIVYPAVILAASPRRRASEAFLAFLRSSRGRARFEAAGFRLLDGDPGPP